jgi:hypothetical protein
LQYGEESWDVWNLQHPVGMFEIYNIPSGCCKFQTSLPARKL